MRERLDELERYRRPLLCTEWLARHHGSKFASHLPLFRERNVGIYLLPATRRLLVTCKPASGGGIGSARQGCRTL